MITLLYFIHEQQVNKLIGKVILREYLKVNFSNSIKSFLGMVKSISVRFLIYQPGLAWKGKKEKERILIDGHHNLFLSVIHYIIGTTACLECCKKDSLGKLNAEGRITMPSWNCPILCDWQQKEGTRTDFQRFYPLDSFGLYLKFSLLVVHLHSDCIPVGISTGDLRL